MELNVALFLYWGPTSFGVILVTLLFHHFNGRTKSRKIHPPDVLTTEDDEDVVAWVLNM
jgi:hypothetical protein